MEVGQEFIGRVEGGGQAFAGLGVEVGLSAGFIRVVLDAEVEAQRLAHELGAAAVLAFAGALDLSGDR